MITQPVCCLEEREPAELLNKSFLMGGRINSNFNSHDCWLFCQHCTALESRVQQCTARLVGEVRREASQRRSRCWLSQPRQPQADNSGSNLLPPSPAHTAPPPRSHCLPHSRSHTSIPLIFSPQHPKALPTATPLSPL